MLRLDNQEVLLLLASLCQGLISCLSILSGSSIILYRYRLGLKLIQKRINIQIGQPSSNLRDELSYYQLTEFFVFLKQIQLLCQLLHF